MILIEFQILTIQSGTQINHHPERLIIQLNTSLSLTYYSSNAAVAIFVSVFVLFLASHASADPPEVDSIIAPTQGLEGVALQYSVSNVIDPDDPDNGTVDTTWDFDDGSGYTSNESFFNIYHTFNNDGVYNVSLTMVDSDGETNSTNWSVTISNRAPIIDSFTIPYQGEIGQSLTFSLVVFDSDSVSVLWDFGEGTIISGGNSQTPLEVNHAFSSIGKYNVTVTATDSDGASTQVIRIIEIIAPPDDRNNLSDYAIISFVVLYSVYSIWRRRGLSNNKD